MSQSDDLLAFLRNQIGKPYVLGATGPDEYDCSGLMYTAFKEVCDIEIPRVSTDQYGAGTEVDRADLKPGDMVFFDTGWSDRNPDHCGVYTGDGNFINANSYYNGVKEESMNSGYWNPLYYGARRILNDYEPDNTSSTTTTSTSNTASTVTNVSTVASTSATIIGTSTSTLKKGSQGTAVTSLQQKLQSYGYFEETVDGNYGDATVQAVKEFQITYQLISSPSDTIAGVYENDTKQKLENLAAPFADVSLSNNNARYIAYLHNRDIAEGYAGGVFKPDQEINRAEALKIILETFDISTSGSVNLPFKDVKSTDWFYPYVKTAFSKDIIDGFETPEGTMFKPGNNITRAEAAKIILSVGNINLLSSSSVNFADNKQADWHYKHILTAYEMGMLEISGTNTIEPNNPITRGDLCRAIVRADLAVTYDL